VIKTEKHPDAKAYKKFCKRMQDEGGKPLSYIEWKTGVSAQELAEWCDKNIAPCRDEKHGA